jgi:hypothetical protein
MRNIELTPDDGRLIATVDVEKCTVKELIRFLDDMKGIDFQIQYAYESGVCGCFSPPELIKK